MSSLRKRLRERAEAELDTMVGGLSQMADDMTANHLAMTGPELLRIAGGGKIQVLRDNVIKRLCDETEAQMISDLDGPGES